MKVLCIAIASKSPLYDKFAEVWKMYMNSRPWIKSFLIYGGSDKLKVVGDEIHFPVHENFIPGILHKTIWAMRETIGLEYDYLLRTNLSSFWILDRIPAFLEKIPKTNTIFSNYEYPIVANAPGMLDGSGMWFSKDVVQKICNHKDFNYSAPDDRELSYIAMTYGAKLIHKPFYFWISDSPDIEATENIKCLESTDCFQVRIRNPYHDDKLYRDENVRMAIDCKIHRILYFYYYVLR